MRPRAVSLSGGLLEPEGSSTSNTPMVDVEKRPSVVKHDNLTRSRNASPELHRAPSGKRKGLELVSEPVTMVQAFPVQRRASISSPIAELSEEQPSSRNKPPRTADSDSALAAHSALRHQSSLSSLLQSSMSPPSRPPRHPSRPPMAPSQVPLQTHNGATGAFKSLKRPSSSMGFVEAHITQVNPSFIPGAPGVLRKKSLSRKSVNNAPSVISTISQSSDQLSLPQSLSASEKQPVLPPIPVPQFSTADRTILEELRQSLKARDAQFTIKNGKKHHPYDSSIVPYPRNYERVVVDHDVWEVGFMQQLCKSVTWHTFDEPPTKVLELGCGTGAWTMAAARLWKQTHFVGLDIVPLHPDLQRVGSSDLASRITWMQANFLDGLPFPNEDFDYVRVMRISRGVPEDKWYSLMEEISRVMKPGAAIEIIEEDLYFPGLQADQPDSSSPIVPSKPPSSLKNVMTPRAQPSKPPRHFSDDESHDDITDSTPDGTNTTPATSTSATSLSSTGLVDLEELTPPGKASGKVFSQGNSRRALSSPVPNGSLAPLKSRFSQTAANLSRNMSLPQPLSSRPVTPIPPATPQPDRKRPTKVASTIKPFSQRERWDETTDWQPPAKLSNASGTTIANSFHDSKISLIPTTPGNASLPPSIEMKETKHKSPVTTPKTKPTTAPVTKGGDVFKVDGVENPRDHTLLQLIYKEMHAARFINLNPLSLLGNLVALYFVDVRSHAPFSIAYPPVAGRKTARWMKQENTPRPAQPVDAGDESDDSLSADGYDGNDEDDHTGPADTAKPSSKNRVLHREDVYDGSQPYLIVDKSRAPVLSHLHIPQSARSTPRQSRMMPSSSDLSLPKGDGQLPIFLPNSTMDFDVRSLNMHLSARVHEILACAEAMWEWVLEYQDHCRRLVREGKSLFEPEGKLLLVGGVVPTMPMNVLLTAGLLDSDPTKEALRKMTRSDFDACLSRFEMDMRNRSALGMALKDNLGLRCAMPVTDSAEQQAFNEACEKWDNAQAAETVRTSKTGVQQFKRSEISSPKHAKLQLSRTLRIFVAWKDSMA